MAGAVQSTFEHPRARVIVASVLLILAVHLSYQFVVAPAFSYMKLTYTDPNPAVYLPLVALTVAVACVMPTRLNRPSDFVLWVLYVAIVIPSMLVSYLARTLPDILQLTLGFVITGCFSAAVLLARLPDGRLSERIPKATPRVFWSAVIAWSVLTYGMLVATGAIRFEVPSLTQVYTVRSAYAEHLASSRIVGYLVSPQANVINPLVVATGLYLRRYWMVALGLFGELVIYSAAAYKTVLFAIPVLLVVAWFYRGGRRPSGTLIPLGFCGVTAGSALIDQLLHTPWLSSLFTRRFLDLPGVLTGAWVEIFSRGPKVLFSYSFLSPFFTNPYPTDPAFVVGAEFLEAPDASANASLLADGYANLGWFGIAVETGALTVALVLANKLSKGIPQQISVLIFVMPAVTLANSSVFTSLLTHGILLGLLMVAVAPRSIWAHPPSSGAATRALTRLPVTASPDALEGSAALGGVPVRESWWQRGKRARAGSTRALLLDGPAPSTGSPGPDSVDP